MDFELTKEQKDIKQAARGVRRRGVRQGSRDQARQGALLPALDLEEGLRARLRRDPLSRGVRRPGARRLRERARRRGVLPERFGHRHRARAERFRLRDHHAPRVRGTEGGVSPGHRLGRDDLGRLLHRAQPRQRHHRDGYDRREGRATAGSSTARRRSSRTVRSPTSTSCCARAIRRRSRPTAGSR